MVQTKKMRVRAAAVSLILAALFGAFSGQQPSLAEPSGDIRVTDAWIRYNPMNGRPSAGYFVVQNTGGTLARLTGLDMFGAGRGMIHQTYEQDGHTSMRHVMAVDVAAGATVAFAPGRFHLMLFDLSVAADQGEIKLGLQVSGPNGTQVVPIQFKVCGFAVVEMC